MDYMHKITQFCKENQVSTTEVADALGKMGVFPKVLPINTKQYRIGPVRCVFTSNGSNYAVHEQVREVQRGEVVILFSHKCEELAIIGDLIAKFTLVHRGAEAIVVQGMVRDAAKLRTEGFSIWSDGVSPLGCHNRPTEPYPKGLAVVATLPEADRAFINAQCRPKRPQGQPSQNAGGAELAARDKVFAVSSHDDLHCSCDTSLTAPQISTKQRNKCALDGLVVMLPARVEQPFPDQGCDLGLPDLKRQAAQPGASAGAVQPHARHGWRSCCDGGGHRLDQSMLNI
jgi:hypothetical protein